MTDSPLAGGFVGEPHFASKLTQQQINPPILEATTAYRAECCCGWTTPWTIRADRAMQLGQAHEAEHRPYFFHPEIDELVRRAEGRPIRKELP